VIGTRAPADQQLNNTADFDELYERFHRELFGIAYRVTGDREEAEDVAQEALLRLNGAEVMARPEPEIGAWLRRVSLNLAANRVRSRKRETERLDRAGRLESSSEVEGPERTVEREEERRRVRRALLTLPDRQRDCLLLRHSGYSYTEIATTLEIATGSVGVLLARAERAFRDQYLGDSDGLS
jgi:RNA polymerase sigma-70 factor (ECF subfamily)